MPADVGNAEIESDVAALFAAVVTAHFAVVVATAIAAAVIAAFVATAPSTSSSATSFAATAFAITVDAESSVILGGAIPAASVSPAFGSGGFSQPQLEGAAKVIQRRIRRKYAEEDPGKARSKKEARGDTLEAQAGTERQEGKDPRQREIGKAVQGCRAGEGVQG